MTFWQKKSELIALVSTYDSTILQDIYAKMFVTCQRFGDFILFGLWVWQYSTNQNQFIIKVGSKSWLLT